MLSDIMIYVHLKFHQHLINTNELLNLFLNFV